MVSLILNPPVLTYVRVFLFFFIGMISLAGVYFTIRKGRRNKSKASFGFEIIAIVLFGLAILIYGVNEFLSNVFNYAILTPQIIQFVILDIIPLIALPFFTKWAVQITKDMMKPPADHKKRYVQFAIARLVYTIFIANLLAVLIALGIVD